MGKFEVIEITFPIPVDLSVSQMRLLDAVVHDICDHNCPEGHAMWPSGCGSKPTYMAMTKEEEEGREEAGLPPIEFDDSIYSISCSIKEKHPRDKKSIKGREVIKDGEEGKKV